MAYRFLLIPLISLLVYPVAVMATATATATATVTTNGVTQQANEPSQAAGSTAVLDVVVNSSVPILVADEADVLAPAQEDDLEERLKRSDQSDRQTQTVLGTDASLPETVVGDDDQTNRQPVKSVFNSSRSVSVGLSDSEQSSRALAGRIDLDSDTVTTVLFAFMYVLIINSVLLIVLLFIGIKTLRADTYQRF